MTTSFDQSSRSESSNSSVSSGCSVNGRKAPRVTNSGTAKLYRPTMLKWLELSGQNRARSSSAIDMPLDRRYESARMNVEARTVLSLRARHLQQVVPMRLDQPRGDHVFR